MRAMGFKVMNYIPFYSGMADMPNALVLYPPQMAAWSLGICMAQSQTG
jgi:hypothetical protein